MKTINSVLFETCNPITYYYREILKNVDFIYELSLLYGCEYDKNTLGSTSIDENKPINRTRLSNNDIVKIAQKIIKSIDENYLLEFNKMIKNRNLEIRNKPLIRLKKYNSKTRCDYNYSEECINSNPKIVLEKNDTFEDIVDLIHEFIHYIQTKDKKQNRNYIFLSEFSSIFFEESAREYLIKNVISKENLDDRFRLIDKYNCVKYPKNSC